MSVDNGADFKAYLVSGATCTYSSGKLSVSAGTCTEVVYIDNYTLSGTPSQIGVTAFGDANTKTINGIMTYTMTATGSYDASATSQDSIRSAADAGSLLVWRLKKNGSKEAKTFSARISNLSESGTPSGKIALNFGLALQSIPKDCTYT